MKRFLSFLKHLLRPISIACLIQPGSIFAAGAVLLAGLTAPQPLFAVGESKGSMENMEPLSLWYDRPADFVRETDNEGSYYRSLLFEGTLIGNGRMGAMIKGQVEREVITLSEGTLHAGGLNPSAMMVDNFGSMQALGDLVIELPGHQPFEQYRRNLDLNRALAGVRYTSGGVTYQREYFASYPGHLVAIRLTASRPGSYSGVLRFVDAHQRLASFKKNLLTIPGTLENGLKYETQILLLNEGGTQKITGDVCEQKIEFEKCDSLTILVAAGTDYACDSGKRFSAGKAPHELITQRIQEATALGYDSLKARHMADYQSLFNRFDLDLGSSSEAQRALPTDRRRLEAVKEQDPEFERLVCQYGRYLMIACSRPGGVPAKSCGLWSGVNFPIWRGGSALDISPIPDSYFGVEPSNLPECHEPLLDLIQAFIPVCRKLVQNAPDLKLSSGEFTKRGWEIRANWNPRGGMWGWWNKGGNAWFCNLFWEHFMFSNDREYLRKTVYPMLKEICEYWEDHLKALPDGRLIVPDMMYSPEHGPFHVDGCSYCQELVFDVFTNYLDATEILNVDPNYRKKVAEMREKLLKPGIGSWGQLLEWKGEMKDVPDPHADDDGGHFDTSENEHRHCSHLLAVYPLRQISYEQTPELAVAAKVSAIARGVGEKRGFYILSFIHRIPVYARLYDGDRAYDLLRRSYGKMEGTNLAYAGGEMSMSLAHPSGYCEMLVQSHQKDIHVLPALPKAWPTGWVKGIRARGGYEVDVNWKDGRLTSLTIRSIAGNDVKVRYGKKTVTVKLSPGMKVELDGELKVKG